MDFSFGVFRSKQFIFSILFVFSKNLPKKSLYRFSEYLTAIQNEDNNKHSVPIHLDAIMRERSSFLWLLENQFKSKQHRNSFAQKHTKEWSKKNWPIYTMLHEAKHSLPIYKTFGIQINFLQHFWSFDER